MMLAEKIKHGAIENVGTFPVGRVAGLGDDCRFGVRHACGEHAQHGWRRIEVGVARHQKCRHFQGFQFGPSDFHVADVLGRCTGAGLGLLRQQGPLLAHSAFDILILYCISNWR